jgi:3-hydroxybutyryl-CoA dehydrogenase
MADLPQRIGVVGAGAMGAGIAQLGVLAGFETHLHDPYPGALERGFEYARAGLEKGASRGRWSEADAAAALGRLKRAPTLDDLSPCELVIEAAPEDAELKRELFAGLSRVCEAGTVLATNTSSILVTSLAGAAEHPENVVGMHFFNPPPLMKLLELIAAEQTGERAMDVARTVGEAMGKTVIVANDGPGFLVNRCGRPFGGEALRLLQERIATVEQIDRIVRLGGGFKMGPFELMDLVGIDVGFEVAKSFDAQAFGAEPRWKPSMLQARKVAAGTLGRKTGAGWYEYADGRPHRPDDPEPPPIAGGEGRRVAVDGSGPLGRELRERAKRAGFDAREYDEFGGREQPELIVDASIPSLWTDIGVMDGGPPTIVACADESLAERELPSAGFHLLPPLESSRLVELTRSPLTSDATADAAAGFFTKCGFHLEWVGDAPGLVLGRIVAQLVNEAAFAVGEGVGSAADVNAGLELGLNHPRGALAWGSAIGWDHVHGIVDGLWAERYGERYRSAPLLRRAAISGMDIGEPQPG